MLTYFFYFSFCYNYNHRSNKHMITINIIQLILNSEYSYFLGILFTIKLIQQTNILQWLPLNESIYYYTIHWRFRANWLFSSRTSSDPRTELDFHMGKFLTHTQDKIDAEISTDQFYYKIDDRLLIYSLISLTNLFSLLLFYLDVKWMCSDLYNCVYLICNRMWIFCSVLEAKYRN